MNRLSTVVKLTNNLVSQTLKFESKKSGFRYLSSFPASCYLSDIEVTKRVIDVVRTIKSCPEQIKNDSLFVADLGFDSLIRKELYTKLSDEFCVDLSEKDKNSMISIESTTKYFSSHPKAR